MTEPLYLDHNATTPVAPEVVDAMVDALRSGWGNPASDHPFGRAARARIDRARAEVAALIGAHLDDGDEILFTSGGTEADNLAVFGVLSPGDRVATSAIEHPAIADAVRADPSWEVRALSAGPTGVVEVPEAFEPRTALVTVMLANNETGVIQPIRALADRARAVGAVVHTDAAQAVGKIPVDVDRLGVDLLTIAGHKLYAPKGVGALYVRRGTRLRPILRGGGQQAGLRPGTEATAQVVGLGAACRIAGERLEAEAARQRAVRDRLMAELRARVPGLAVTGDGADRLPNTLHVRFPRTTGDRVLARAPGIAASTGSACHAGIDHPSAVLTSMGLAAEDALGAVRLSIGRSTTTDDAIRAAAGLGAAWTEAIGG